VWLNETVAVKDEKEAYRNATYTELVNATGEFDKAYRQFVRVADMILELEAEAGNATIRMHQALIDKD